jgi:hypothetical protein
MNDNNCNPMYDSREPYDADYEAWLDATAIGPYDDSDLDFEDDGQPDEYTEWQDYMGGDDWDFGQYDEAY